MCKDDNKFIICVCVVFMVCCALAIWLLITIISFIFIPNRGYCLLTDSPELTIHDDLYKINIITYFQEGCDTKIEDNFDYNVIEYYTKNSVLANRTYIDMLEYYTKEEAFYCIKPKMLGEGKLPLPKNKC